MNKNHQLVCFLATCDLVIFNKSSSRVNDGFGDKRKTARRRLLGRLYFFFKLLLNLPFANILQGSPLKFDDSH